MVTSVHILWVAMLIICTICFTSGAEVHEGEECTIESENIRGIYTIAPECSWALKRAQQMQHVSIFDIKNEHPIICCPLNETNSYKHQVNASSDDRIVCCPLKESNNSRPTMNTTSIQSHNSMKERKSLIPWSEKKCVEYYPPNQVFIVGAGGRKSAAQEFPHMAILGYGTETEKYWKCGGSLISHQHILTAAHCVESIDFGEVKFVRLGDLDILKDTDDADPQELNVKLALPHPDFDPSTLKHDIAVLILDKPVRITKYVMPGCLSPGGNVRDIDYVTATGWGITQLAGPQSNHLIKLELKVVNHTECTRQYERAGARGKIDENFQICAGSAHPGKIIDTCEGDSGGPLQFKSFRNREHHVIFGVTSFGKACGITKSAGVYTRVSSYLSWIEPIVENRS